MSINRKTLPPYGHRTLQDQSLGQSNCVTVFVGKTAFQHAASAKRRPLLVIPHGKDPADFDWQRIVNGREILVVEFGSDEPRLVARAAQAFLTAGATKVVAVHSHARDTSVFKSTGAENHAA